MARVKPKPKFGRNDVVVCWQTIGVPEEINPEGVIKKGLRLRGNHPWVREFEFAFIPEDTPDDEWPSPLTGLSLPPRHESNITLAPRLPANELVRCIHNIGGLGGRLLYEKGRLYRRDLVAADVIERFPDCFEEVEEDA